MTQHITSLTAPSHVSLEKIHATALSSYDAYMEERALHFAQKIKHHTLHCAHSAVWHESEVTQHMRAMVATVGMSAAPQKTKEKKSQLTKSQPFYGLFMGVKDLFCTAGLTTTAGSRVLEHYKPPFSSFVYASLCSKGAVMSCKTSMDEFAMGSYTNTSFLGKTSLPDHATHSAGGSSGGSAVAVMSGLCDFALGSDTGGSIRQPASHCGIVGYKPTYGALSRQGMIAYASSLDQAGLFTKTVEDLSYLLAHGLLSRDPQDMTSMEVKRSLGGDALENLEKPLSQVRVGYLPHLLDSEHIESSVKKVYQKTLDVYKALGIELVAVPEDSIPTMRKAAEIYYVIACAEASSCMARYQGVYFGAPLSDFVTAKNLSHLDFWHAVSEYRGEYLGLEVQKRIMLGSYVLASSNFEGIYMRAVSARELLKAELNSVMGELDMLCLPVCPTTAVAWDKIETLSSAQTYMADFLTVPFSLAGLPAMSVPMGEDHAKMQIGMQLVGKKGEDYALVELARRIMSDMKKD